MELTGIISPEGKLLSPYNDALIAWCKKNIGKTVKLTITAKGKKRSNPQNRYYHGVVVPLIKDALIDLGHDVDEDDTHYFLKGKFNSVEIENKSGITEEMPGSTAKLSTFEFEAYLDRIRMWAAQFLNIYIPLPNEPMNIDFESTLIASHDNEIGATIVEKANH